METTQGWILEPQAIHCRGGGGHLQKCKKKKYNPASRLSSGSECSVNLLGDLGKSQDHSGHQFRHHILNLIPVYHFGLAFYMISHISG